MFVNELSYVSLYEYLRNKDLLFTYLYVYSVRNQLSTVLNYQHYSMRIENDKIMGSLSKTYVKEAFVVLFVTRKCHQNDFQ